MLQYVDTLIGFAVVMLGLSMTITILTQMVSALMSHRGANLQWGLQTLFEQSSFPALQGAAAQLSHTVLTHPLISDSIFSLRIPKWVPVPAWFKNRFQLATAIHPEELVAILSRLANTTEAGTPVGTGINALLGAQNPTAERQVNLLLNSTALTGLEAAQRIPLLETTVDTVRQTVGAVEAAFSTMMARTSARFTTYMRAWTIVFAILVAAITGTDSISLVKKIYTHSDLRDKLVSASPQMTELAKKLVPEDAQNNADAAQNALTKLFTDAVKTALVTAKATADTLPSGIRNTDEGNAWIKQHVTEPTQQTAALGAFKTEADTQIEALVKEDVKNAKQIRDVLTSSGFEVFRIGWDSPWYEQIPGVLVTAAFLSLGAPFWFNLLKSLTNLRPTLANKTNGK
jgi:hypothetical protein